MIIVWIFVLIVLLGALYLLHVNHAMMYPPEEALQMAHPRWTQAELREAYSKYSTAPSDVQQLLPRRTSRRYIVIGGSGLVGGWIVQNLLERGEDPQAIRILDLASPRRPIIIKSAVQFFKTDIADATSVVEAFGQPWPSSHISAPLTVFHTAAYIQPGYRYYDFLSKYTSVNENGTRNVISAAKAAGCSVFIATSSASVGLKPINFFLWPWSKHPSAWFQVIDNADPVDPNAGLEKFGGCYAYSKMRAENIVRDWDSKKDGFRTGAIRPGHAIYGHGEKSPMSIGYDCLRRGGIPTWISELVTQYVSAQNVSLGNLLFEYQLLNPKNDRDIGGRAYAITDPGPPIRCADLYTALSTLAHQSTPLRFPKVPPVLMLLISHCVEAYILLRRRYIGFLPEVVGDFALLQPALMRVSTLNLVYTTERAREELGYEPILGTLEGICLQAKEWNNEVEAKLAEASVPKQL